MPDGIVACLGVFVMKAVTNAAGEHAPTRGGLLAEQNQPWFDVGDLARRYKTSVRHIYRMANGGRMPWGVKLGQLRRWSRRDIEAWEADGCNPVELPRSAARSAKAAEGGRRG